VGVLLLVEVVVALAAVEEGEAELEDADSVGVLLPLAGGADAEVDMVAMVLTVVDGKVAVVVATMLVVVLE